MKKRRPARLVARANPAPKRSITQHTAPREHRVENSVRAAGRQPDMMRPFFNPRRNSGQCAENEASKHGYRLCDRIPSFKVLRFYTDYLSVTSVIIRLLFIRLFKRAARVALIAIPFLKFDNRQKNPQDIDYIENYQNTRKQSREDFAL